MGIFLVVLPQSFTQGRSQHTKRKSIFSTLVVPIGTQAIYFTCNLYFAQTLTRKKFAGHFSNKLEGPVTTSSDDNQTIREKRYLKIAEQL